MASSQPRLGMCRKARETWIILYEIVVKLLQKVYATQRMCPLIFEVVASCLLPPTALLSS